MSKIHISLSSHNFFFLQKLDKKPRSIFRVSIITPVICPLAKGPFTNDVSSEGEGEGPPSKPIYYISLFSNLSRQWEGGGHKIGKMGRRRLWMAPKIGLQNGVNALMESQAFSSLGV